MTVEVYKNFLPETLILYLLSISIHPSGVHGLNNGFLFVDK